MQQLRGVTAFEDLPDPARSHIICQAEVEIVDICLALWNEGET